MQPFTTYLLFKQLKHFIQDLLIIKIILHAFYFLVFFMPFSCEALLGLPSWSDWTISVSPQFRFINESGLAGVAPPDDTE